MTVEQAQECLKRLQAYYPQMAKLDELAISAWLEEIGPMRYEDAVVGIKQIAKVSKFFPSLAELVEVTEEAARNRFQAKDREEREERLALQAAEDKIMDPKSEVHRVVVGPNHQIFLDYVSGKRTFPEPDWVKRKKVQA